MGTKQRPGPFDCYANAKPDEPMFVLLARDPHAPSMVRVWADKYLSSKMRTTGVGPAELAKFNEAAQCADDMEVWRLRNTL